MQTLIAWFLAIFGLYCIYLVVHDLIMYDPGPTTNIYTRRIHTHGHKRKRSPNVHPVYEYESESD